MLESGHKHPAIKGLRDNMAAVGILGTVPWLMSMLSKIPGATGSYEIFGVDSSSKPSERYIVTAYLK
jgi:hypothetical protein